MEVATPIRDFIKREILLGDVGLLPADDSPLLNGVLDSGGLMFLVSFLEEEFDIEIDDLEIVPDNFATVSSLEGFVQRKVQEG